ALLDAWLSQLEPAGAEPIRIAAALESAEGLFRAAEIARSSPRLTAILFGGGDLSGQIGCPLAWEPMLHARHTVVLAATLAGVDALDVPYLDVEDDRGLEEEARRVAQLGFRGKVVIHPRQIATVNAVFTPSSDELAWAERVLAAARKQGTGAIRLDGKMIDLAVIKRAERIAAVAQRTPKSLEG
ncbi:MAG TPA: CoA ester lyase, partial [Bacillota bacterium]